MSPKAVGPGTAISVFLQLDLSWNVAPKGKRFYWNMPSDILAA